MSPNYWYQTPSQAFSIIIGGSSDSGKILSNYVIYNVGVRPVISLKSCVQYNSGDGTASNPYTVKLTDTCSTAEN